MYDIPSRPFLRGQPVSVPSIKLWLGNALPGVHSGNQTWLAGKSWKIPEVNAGRNGKIIEPTMTWMRNLVDFHVWLSESRRVGTIIPTNQSWNHVQAQMTLLYMCSLYFSVFTCVYHILICYPCLQYLAILILHNFASYPIKYTIQPCLIPTGHNVTSWASEHPPTPVASCKPPRQLSIAFCEVQPQKFACTDLWLLMPRLTRISTDYQRLYELYRVSISLFKHEGA